MKVEPDYPAEHDSFEDVVADLPGFIASIYYAKRLHSGLGCPSPDSYKEINAQAWSKSAA